MFPSLSAAKRCITTMTLFALTTCTPLWAKTYNVGIGRETKSLAAIAAQLKPGDVVEIDPGTYREVMKLLVNGTPTAPITIRGVGTARPVFDAEGLNTSGRGPIPRGILQIEGAYIIIEHLEFKNARNGENAAGIRLLASTNAIIRDCAVNHCDMGIFGDDRETVTVENCDIGFNSAKERDGYAHNFYMHGNRVVVRGCHIHDAPFGQNFKSRAHFNELWYNWIADSHQGEVGPVDSDHTERANSNTLMVGNVIISPRERTGNASKFILFGSESGNSHDGTLFLFHNTFVAGNPRINFITLDDTKARAVVRNNIFVGSAQILNTPRPPLSVVGSGNWMPAGAPLPQGWDEVSTAPLQYTDGDGVTHTLTIDATSMPYFKAHGKPHLSASAPALGAFGR